MMVTLKQWKCLQLSVTADKRQAGDTAGITAPHSPETKMRRQLDLIQFSLLFSVLRLPGRGLSVDHVALRCREHMNFLRQF